MHFVREEISCLVHSNQSPSWWCITFGQSQSSLSTKLQYKIKKCNKTTMQHVKCIIQFCQVLQQGNFWRNRSTHRCTLHIAGKWRDKVNMEIWVNEGLSDSLQLKVIRCLISECTNILLTLCQFFMKLGIFPEILFPSIRLQLFKQKVRTFWGSKNFTHGEYEWDIQICHICQPGKGWGQLSCDDICRNETVREKWEMIPETLQDN